MLNPNETYVSIDIETNGAIPGDNSMLSLGAVAFDHQGNELASWYSTIARIGKGDQDTLAWWRGFSVRYNEAIENPTDPLKAMEEFDGWLYNLPGKKVLVANPAAWDGMFVTWYAKHFLGRFLCTKHRVLDTRSFAFGKFGGGFLEAPERVKELMKRFAAENPKPHHALEDAREQGKLFCALAL